MKPPGFWQSPHRSLWAAVLWPVTLLYRLGASLRRTVTRPVAVDAKVLCVGNVTVGGAGKTPVVIALAKAAGKQGIRVAIVSRGYGGRLVGPVCVDPTHHSARDVGDEPMLLAAHAPTWISRDRVQGAMAAQTAGADLVLLDDGFQNPSLQKDFSLLVFDGGYGIGNGAVFPAGPLREPVDSALLRADMCLLIGQDERNLTGTVLRDAEVEVARLVPEPSANFERNSPYVAFAGIGIPEKFFRTLRAMGLELAAAVQYPDHYQYTKKDLNELMLEAQKNRASLVTTRKDYVRIPESHTEHVQVLDVALECETAGTMEQIIRKAMDHG